ncbi:MAG: hypothetical protein AAGD25_25205 [Cyanobacteria bacterium P01_F01_bin.150]
MVLEPRDLCVGDRSMGIEGDRADLRDFGVVRSLNGDGRAIAFFLGSCMVRSP